MGNRCLLAIASLVLALPAAAAIPEPGGLVPNLRAPANEEPAFTLTGNGVYIYQCRAALNLPDAFEWGFVGPDATLYEGSRSVARHATAGLYESLSDRSSVSGVVRTSQGAGPANLPWALMRAQSVAETGTFAGVTSIQRVNTTGGAAPAGGCGTDNLGAEARVAYQADYYFYRARGAR